MHFRTSAKDVLYSFPSSAQGTLEFQPWHQQKRGAGYDIIDTLDTDVDVEGLSP